MAVGKVIRVFPLLIFLICVSACSRRFFDSYTPNFYGRIFALDQIERKLYEIKLGPSAARTEYQLISDQVADAALSPDGKYLLYHLSVPGPDNLKDKLVLRNLSSAEDKP